LWWWFIICNFLLKFIVSALVKKKRKAGSEKGVEEASGLPSLKSTLDNWPSTFDSAKIM
jgi:hypothetical protein